MDFASFSQSSFSVFFFLCVLAELVLSYYFDLSAACERRTAVILLGPPWAILKPLAFPIFPRIFPVFEGSQANLSNGKYE